MATTNQHQVLGCLERLVELAKQQHQVLKARRHADLAPLVAAEEAVLAELEALQANAAPLQAEEGALSSATEDACALQRNLAALRATLKELNAANAALIQEHLQGVEMCLHLIDNAARPTYSAPGNGKGEKVVNSLFDVRA